MDGFDREWKFSFYCSILWSFKVNWLNKIDGSHYLTLIPKLQYQRDWNNFNRKCIELRQRYLLIRVKFQQFWPISIELISLQSNNNSNITKQVKYIQLNTIIVYESRRSHIFLQFGLCSLLLGQNGDSFMKFVIACLVIEERMHDFLCLWLIIRYLGSNLEGDDRDNLGYFRGWWR